MSTVTVNEKDILDVYNQADTNGKGLLSKLFKKELLEQNIMHRVKSYEDACEILKHTDALPFKVAFLNNDQKAINAFAQLSVIAKALNEGWTPDWNNDEQYKYTPWFKMDSTGLDFSYPGYDLWSSDSDVGSRLCYKSSELAEYAGKQFIELYREFFAL